MKKFFGQNIIYIAWIQALVATCGSLFFSEVLHFTPCVLCWYQRICMYPLVIILTVGILEKNKKIYRYILPLSLTGLVISVYHNLLYFGVIPESIAPCIKGISCTTKFFAWFGFITIPLLSLTAFSVITLCMFIYRSYNTQR